LQVVAHHHPQGGIPLKDAMERLLAVAAFQPFGRGRIWLFANMLVVLLAACERGGPPTVASPTLAANDRAAFTEAALTGSAVLSPGETYPYAYYDYGDSTVTTITDPGNYEWDLCTDGPFPDYAYEFWVNSQLAYGHLGGSTDCEPYIRSTTGSSSDFTIFGKVRDTLTQAVEWTSAPLWIVHVRILPTVNMTGGLGAGTIPTGTFTWTADAAGAHPPFTYTWERRNFCDLDYSTVGSGSTYTEQTFAGEQSFFLRVTVTDTLGGTAVDGHLVGHFEVCWRMPREARPRLILIGGRLTSPDVSRCFFKGPLERESFRKWREVV
jgi:hypothetical protein